MGNKKKIIFSLAVILLAGAVFYFLMFINTGDGNSNGSASFFSNFNLMELLQNSKSNKPESKDFRLDTDIFKDPKYGQLKRDNLPPDIAQKPGKDNPFEPAE
jgi:hypothetical protein